MIDVSAGARTVSAVYREPVLGTCVAMTTMQVGGQRREVSLVPLKLLNGFLSEGVVVTTMPSPRGRQEPQNGTALVLVRAALSVGIPKSVPRVSRAR